MPLEEQFWGDTYGILVDPFGQTWSMSDVRSDEKPDPESASYQEGAQALFPSKSSKKKPPAKAAPKKSPAKAKRAPAPAKKKPARKTSAKRRR
jgi:hypothetical protein